MANITLIYRLWCTTEGVYKFVDALDTDAVPTTCPSNSGDTIDTTLTTVVDQTNPELELAEPGQLNTILDEKTALIGTDVFLLEDSEDDYSKKRVSFTNLELNNSKTKVTSNDTTPAYLKDKMIATEGIQATELNNGGNEALQAKLNINGLTADGSPDSAADYVATYDASAGVHKKVLIDDLGGESYCDQYIFAGKPGNGYYMYYNSDAQHNQSGSRNVDTDGIVVRDSTITKIFYNSENGASNTIFKVLKNGIVVNTLTFTAAKGSKVVSIPVSKGDLLTLYHDDNSATNPNKTFIILVT